MNITKEAKKLCDRLLGYTKMARDNPDIRDSVIKTCREEIEMAELLVAAKSKTSPLVTRNLFKDMIPEEVKILINIGGEEI